MERKPCSMCADSEDRVEALSAALRLAEQTNRDLAEELMEAGEDAVELRVEIARLRAVVLAVWSPMQVAHKHGDGRNLCRALNLSP